MRKLLAILCLAVLGLAGCGGGGGGDVDVASNKSDDAGDTAGSDGDDPEFTGKGGKNFCEYLKELEGKEGDLSLKGDGSDSDSARAKKGLKVLDEIEDKAPAELKADILLVIKQVRPIFATIAEGKKYDPTTADQPTEAEAKEFEEAGKRVETYSSDVCGIKDEDAPPASTPAEPPSGDEQAPADEDVPADG